MASSGGNADGATRGAVTDERPAMPCQLAPIDGAELAQQRGDVRLHGALREDEPLGDLRVGEAPPTSASTSASRREISGPVTATVCRAVDDPTGSVVATDVRRPEVPDADPMTDTATADEIRATQRETWDTFAPGWEKWDDVVQEMLGPVGDEIVRSLDVGRNDHHLDVAAGTGEPGLRIAAIATGGRVVLTDLSPSMLAAAGRRADVLGLGNVDTRECSADALPFPDATFDSVSCRFGFMFFPDLARRGRGADPGAQAGRSPRRGRVGRPRHQPVGDHRRRGRRHRGRGPAAPPGAPGMFRCAEPGLLSAVFASGGLDDVSEWDVPLTIATSTPEEYWQLVTDCTAPGRRGAQPGRRGDPPADRGGRGGPCARSLR